jgi:hypothetical protein
MSIIRTQIRCERCSEILNPDKVIWLEYSQTDGKYYKELPEDHVSQGAFPFGLACSKKELASNSKQTR